MGWTRSTTCKYIVFILPQNICQHITAEVLLQLFAPFAVSNIPSIRYQQFFYIFFTEICCLQCLQITVIRLKHIFVPLFAGYIFAMYIVQLIYNASKSFSLSFKRKDLKISPPTFFLHHSKIPLVEQFSYLGTTLLFL